jgi:hypothetical protein
VRPGPKAALQVLDRYITIDSPPRSAREWLADICLDRGWFGDPASAEEAAERWSEQLLQLVRDELTNLQEVGRDCTYVLNESSSYMLQGAAYIAPSDGTDVQEAKKRRAQRDSYAMALAGVTPREFEALCTGVLSLLGVREPVLTPGVADEGVDFYGRLELGTILGPAYFIHDVTAQLKPWLIGQAKHYPANQVSTPELRELVGSVRLARAGVYGATTDKYPDLNIRVCDPVFYLFFTTGTYSIPSWYVIKRSGVVGMDGSMLASFLADRGVGTNEVGEFSHKEFVGWVASFLR